MSQPAPFALSHFPHVLACPQSVPPMSQLAHFARPPVALSVCPVSVSKSLYFVRPDDTFVVIGRESYFIHLFCGEIVLATSNDINCPQHFFSREQDVFVIIARNFVSYDISLDALTLFFFFTIKFLDCVELARKPTNSVILYGKNLPRFFLCLNDIFGPGLKHL